MGARKVLRAGIVQPQRARWKRRPDFSLISILVYLMDMLIAAHAMREKVALVKRNQSEFRRVVGLRLEN